MLQDVALTLDEGERVVIVGRSGEGKSTLLAALAAYAGGQGAVVPQAASLVPLSVFHNVHMGRLDCHGSWSNLRELIAPSRAARAAVEALLESLRLGGASRAPAMTLSGGQQQRVAIARALIASRPLLFADEPVSALDRREGREILGVMRGLAPTSVTVLHDLSLTLGHATRVLALRDGRVALDAPASALAERDLAPFFDRR